MSSEDGGNAGTIFMAFILGAIAGASVALLVAPAPGEDARRYLGEKARGGREKAAEAVREGRERAAEAVRQGREFIERQRETAASAIERGKEAFQQARDKEQV